MYDFFFLFLCRNMIKLNQRPNFTWLNLHNLKSKVHQRILFFFVCFCMHEEWVTSTCTFIIKNEYILIQCHYNQLKKKIMLSHIWMSLCLSTLVKKFFIKANLGPLFVFVVIHHMFSSWVHPRTLRFLFGVSILLFSFIDKFDFSCQ